MVIELLSFSLLPGYDEKKFLREIYILINEFIAKQAGYIGVHFAKDPQNSNWVAVHYWDSIENNNLAISQSRQSHAFKQATAGIDMNSIVREQLKVIVSSQEAAKVMA